MYFTFKEEIFTFFSRKVENIAVGMPQNLNNYESDIFHSKTKWYKWNIKKITNTMYYSSELSDNRINFGSILS